MSCGRRAAWEAGPDGAPRPRMFVTVQVNDEGRATYGGVLRCGSPHVCPTCALTLSRSRAEELEYLTGRHLAAGGGALTVALTVRHELRDRLGPLLRALPAAWRRVKSGRAWQSFRRSIGYRGDVRAMETTVGPRHGWHPHLHVLLFLDRPATEAVRAAAEAWLFDRWAAELERLGLDRPERWARDQDGNRKGLGVNVAILQGAAGATYIARANLASVAGDIASATGKVARAGNRTIWQLLQDATGDGRTRDVRLWREWAVASKGHRALTWACRQLREEHGLTDPPSDAELIEAAEDDGGAIVAYIPADVFQAFVRRPGWGLAVLHLAEAHGALAVNSFIHRCCHGWGGRAPPSWWRKEWET